MCLRNETQNRFVLCHKGEINDEEKYQKINLAEIGVYRIGKRRQSYARVHTNSQPHRDTQTRNSATTTIDFFGFNVKQLTVMLQFSVSFKF